MATTTPHKTINGSLKLACHVLISLEKISLLVYSAIHIGSSSARQICSSTLCLWCTELGFSTPTYGTMKLDHTSKCHLTFHRGHNSQFSRNSNPSSQAKILRKRRVYHSAEANQRPANMFASQMTISGVLIFPRSLSDCVHSQFSGSNIFESLRCTSGVVNR